MATALPSTAFCQTSFTFPSQNPCKVKSPSLIFRTKSHGHIRCSAKKKISFVDQILDYIEGTAWCMSEQEAFLGGQIHNWEMTVPPCLISGGPKLRKWYGAPDLLPKDGSDAEDEDELPGNALVIAICGCLYLWFFSWFFHFNCFSFVLRNLVSFSNTEKNEVRDAVLVTDGDSEIGQVCFSHKYWCG